MEISTMYLTMKEKKAIDHIKNIKSWWWNNSPDRIYSINKEDIEQFDIALNLIDKQNKVIDEMANDIYDSQMECGRYFEDKEEVKEHFIRKVEEDGKNNNRKETNTND